MPRNRTPPARVERGMRIRLVAGVATVCAAIAPLAGCASGSTPPPAATTSASAPAPPDPTGPPVLNPTTAPPSAPPAPPGRPLPPTTGGTVGPNDEVPREPMWGTRTLTGTVQRSGTCTMLLVGQRRWALAGPVADGLAAGRRVKVTGHLTPRLAVCTGQETVQTVQVTRAHSA